jgi:hypothetical protein
MLPTPTPQQPASPDNSSLQQQDLNRQQRGTGFTNINRILGANQGAGLREGQAISNGLSNQAGSVQNNINQGQSQFQAGLNDANTAAQSNIQSGSKFVKGSGETDDAYAKRVASDNTTDYSKLGQTLANTTYNGPNSISNADQVKSQAATVGALGQLAGNSAGQSQLLKSMVAQRGNYTTGQNALDNLLVGQEGQGALQQGRQAALGVTQQASNAVDNSSAQALAAKNAIDNQRTSALTNLRSSLSGDGTTDPTANPNGITGIETAAKNAATKYTSDAQRLQQLVRGTDSAGNSFINAPTPTTGADTDTSRYVTDADKALIARMNDFGVKNNNLYIDPSNNSQYQSALGTLAGKFLRRGLGDHLYSDDQKTASTNLAKLLGDSPAQSEIAGSKFNTQILADNGDETGILGGLSDGINGQIGSNQNGFNTVNNWFKENNIPLTGNYFNPDSGSQYGYFKGIPLLASAEGQQYKNYLDLQNNLNSNTTDLQTAVLKRFAAGQG